MNLDSMTMAPLGPPDGTVRWHLAYRRRQAHAEHLAARVVWRAQVQALAALVGGEACNCGEDQFGPAGGHEHWCVTA